jgi:DTW domain-containing protein YfiP
MHQKEFAKTKSNTGRMTHLSLPHSHLFVGIDFTHHTVLNRLLNNPKYTPFILYPGDDAHDLSIEPLQLKEKSVPLFILIDSTWACSKKMMKVSKNLHAIPKVSFSVNKKSQYTIKEQPAEHCLSTIETTQTILELLQHHRIEKIHSKTLDNFLNPFRRMINHQILKAKTQTKLRFKPSGKS